MRWRTAAVWAASLAAPAAAAESIPTIDTEDASLGATDGAVRPFHLIATVDVRNGDYARGAYDDDDAGLDRVPLHAGLAFAIRLGGDGAGQGDVYLIGQSNNGVHAPRADERARPRGWYESNNIVALAWRPAKGLTVATAYAIKASPNGVSATTHEASATVAWSADTGLGRLNPSFVATRRTKGQSGLYTLAGIAPDLPLGPGDDAPVLSLPVMVGVGWGGFYAAGSGTRRYGSAGFAIEQGLRIAGTRASIRGELLALLRDDRLRRLDAPNGRTDALVPLGTIAFSIVW